MSERVFWVTRDGEGSDFFECFLWIAEPQYDCEQPGWLGVGDDFLEPEVLNLEAAQGLTGRILRGGPKSIVKITVRREGE